MHQEKQFVVNLNPDENENVGYLNWRLLYNPFPKTAVGFGGSASSPWTREMDAIRHLRDGVPLKHVRWLLELFLSKEAAIKISRGMRRGQRWHVIVRTIDNGGRILRIQISDEEQRKLRMTTMDQMGAILKRRIEC